MKTKQKFVGNLMKTKRLGRTNLIVSEMALGTWAFGGSYSGYGYGFTDDAVSASTIRKALKLGINFFDTADVYGHGHAENLLGQILAESVEGKSAIVATKVGGRFDQGVEQTDFSPAYIKQACTESLRRLRRETIDLYLLHNAPVEIIADDGVQAALQELRQAGMVRFVGVSVIDRKAAKIAMRFKIYNAVQVVYNLFGQNMIPPIASLASKCSIPLLFREPLANGFLTGKYGLFHQFGETDVRSKISSNIRFAQFCAVERLRFLERKPERSLGQAMLRFALDHPAVGAVIVGAKTPEQLTENVAATAQPSLTATEIRQIYECLFFSEAFDSVG